MADELKRRDFLKTTAAVAAMTGPAVISARGASDKLNIGWIGVGTRGNAGIEWLKTASGNDVKLTAICDTYDGYIARAKDRVQTVWGNQPTAYKDYHKLLADKSIDAVFIMTPEHLHHDMTIAALRAGKHVYIEKPLAHTIEEGWDIIKEWEKAKKVVQVGTQNRSSSLYKKAKDLIAEGKIGDVHFVRAFWYRNARPNEPSWRYDIPAEANPQNTDWKAFLGPAPNKAWDPHRYFQWRLYWDYSGGISTDLLVHQTDIVNFMLGKTTPKTCVASGGVYRWTAKDDDRDVPDCLSAVYDYNDKFQLNYSCYLGNDQYGYGEQIFGNEGTIEVISRLDLKLYRQAPGARGAQTPQDVRDKPVLHLNGLKDFSERDGAINHFRNFVNSVLGKEKPIAPPTVGQQAAISGHMATLAYRNKKMVTWNDATRKYTLG
jgi:predicted dehydrogenase